MAFPPVSAISLRTDDPNGRRDVGGEPWTSRFYVREEVPLTHQNVAARQACEEAGMFWSSRDRACVDDPTIAIRAALGDRPAVFQPRESPQMFWVFQDYVTRDEDRASCDDTCELYGAACADDLPGVTFDDSLMNDMFGQLGAPCNSIEQGAWRFVNPTRTEGGQCYRPPDSQESRRASRTWCEGTAEVEITRWDTPAGRLCACSLG